MVSVETSVGCGDSNDNSVKPMQVWLAEDMSKALGKANYHQCGDDCSSLIAQILSYFYSHLL